MPGKRMWKNPDVRSARKARGRDLDRSKGDRCSNCRNWVGEGLCPSAKTVMTADGLCALFLRGVNRTRA